MLVLLILHRVFKETINMIVPFPAFNSGLLKIFRDGYIVRLYEMKSRHTEGIYRKIWILLVLSGKNTKIYSMMKIIVFQLPM